MKPGGASRSVGQLAVGQFVAAGGILRRAGVNPQRGAPMGEREVRASSARAGGRRVDCLLPAIYRISMWIQHDMYMYI